MKRKFILRSVTMLIVLSVVLASVCAALSTSIGLTEETFTATKVDSFTVATDSELRIKDNMVVNIPFGAKAYYVIDSFEEKCYIRDTEGRAVSKNALVGTGYTLVNIITSRTMQLVVNGDLNGDAKLTSKDIIRAKKYIAADPGYSCYLEALDVNRDGKYTNADLEIMSTTLAGGAYVMPDVEITDTPLGQREPMDIGTDFYATIDIMYTDSVLMPLYSGTNSVVAYKKNLSAEQIWHFTRNSDGTYTIKNLAYNMVLDLSGEAVHGMDVKIYTESTSPAQKWYIVDADDGIHTILYPSNSEGVVLNVTSPEVTNYTNVTIAEFDDSTTQNFCISKVQLDTSESYLDMVEKSDLGEVFYSTISVGGKRVSNRDAALNLYTTKNQPAEMWKFQRQSDGSYSVTNMGKLGYALDIYAGQATNLSKAVLSGFVNSKSQLWNLYIKEGKIVFSSAVSKNIVLDIYSGTFDHGQSVDVYTFNDSAAQKFTLEKMTGNYDPALPKNKHYDILFIGNSFTWYNSMTPVRFPSICSAAGYDVTVKMIEHGGAKLHEYIGNGRYAAEVSAEIEKNIYEYVIIQDQSTNPIYDPTSFYNATRQLASYIRSHGAEVVMYQTWGFHPSHGTTQALNGTVNMEAMLRNAYDNIGYEIGAIMANVGHAFTNVYLNHPSINLYNTADLYHPSTTGSTLVAYTIFASIFRADIRTIDHNFEDSRNVGNALRHTAYDVVFGL